MTPIPNLIEEIEYLGEVGEVETWDVPPLPSSPYLKIKQADVLAVLGRDTAVISNDVVSLPRDNRRWTPTSTYDPGELVSGSSRLELPPGYVPTPYPGKDDPWIKRMRTSPIPGDPKYKEPVRKPREKDDLRKADPMFLTHKLSFRRPDYTEICLKRKMRREVLHALGITGFFHTPRHFNVFSKVRC